MDENIAFETAFLFYRVKATTNCQNATRVTVNHHSPAMSDPPPDQFEIPGGANFQGAVISRGGMVVPPARHEIIVETRRLESTQWHNLCADSRAHRILKQTSDHIVIGFNDWVPFGGAGDTHDNVIIEIELGASSLT